MRILHVFDHSLPLQSGYVTRSLAIIRGQRARGWDTIHLTTPRHNYHAQSKIAERETFHGFTFHRTECRRLDLPVAREVFEMRATERRLRSLVRAERPDIIHAHSPALNAIPALKVGRELRVPVIYEIRALWEDAGADLGRGHEQSVRYRLARWLDTRAMYRADGVVALCEALRAEIITRGISATRISVVPNAVDPTFLAPIQPADQLRRSLGLEGVSVLGFIGSFYAYEGIDLLIGALQQLGSRRADLAVLLVGGGPELQRLRELVKAQDLERKVRFVDRVKVDEVLQYYTLVDLLVLPRRRMRLTDLVTPLKPLEAMAQQTPVLASDVGGHRELIRHNETGFLFRPNDPTALANAIEDALSDRDRLVEIIVNGRRFVEEERDWTTVCGRYEAIYSEALGQRASSYVPG